MMRIFIFCFTLLILLVVLFVFNGGCPSDSSRLQKDPEFVKRSNRINEILDEIDTDFNPLELLFGEISDNYQAMEAVSREEECRFLIDNSDIALPIIFKRLDNKKRGLDFYGVVIYFIVFEKTKSAESIPYIAEYLTLKSKNHRAFKCAIFAAQQITSLEFRHDTYDQRLDIAKKLRQWYQEHKK